MGRFYVYTARAATAKKVQYYKNDGSVVLLKREINAVNESIYLFYDYVGYNTGLTSF